MTGWVESAMPHLIVAPIVLPLVAAALMVALGDRRRVARALVNVLASGACLAVAVALALWVDRQNAPEAIGVYLPSNWPVPFGIVLRRRQAQCDDARADRGPGRCGRATRPPAGIARVSLHPLFQIQLMGLNGAFLTADLFNLFCSSK
jgi:multicomponent K+:H+ antiporter subunit D